MKQPVLCKITLDNKSRIMLIMSTSFLLFAAGMYFVYADANTDVILKRNQIDKIERDINNQQQIVKQLESERNYWENRVKSSEEYLQERIKIEKESERIHEVALTLDVESLEDIDRIERLRDDLERARTDVRNAEKNVTNTKNDLAKYEQRLLDARNKLSNLIKSLPEEEQKLEELREIANRGAANSFATRDGKSIIISIVISEGCKISERCPTYKELADLYDNSNRFISGDFTLVESNITRPVYEVVECEGNCSVRSTVQKTSEEKLMIWERQEPRLGQYTVEWYRSTTIPVLTFVDPDDFTRQASKEIFIEPSMPRGFDKSYELTNSTLNFPEHRKIEGCTRATIGWQPYGHDLLADTWNYFYSNCSAELEFKTTKQEFFEPSYFNDCHTWCEHLKWVASAKEAAKQYLIGK